jgi:hypothetical protein
VLATGLPSACPASAWQVSLPTRLAGAGPGSATVELADTAPAGCQGRTVSLTLTVTASRPGAPAKAMNATSGPVTVAALGRPGVAVARRDGRLAVLTVPDDSGPAATGYRVETLDGQGRAHVVCELTAPTPCDAGPVPAAGSDVRYRVVAALGAWRSASAAIRP